jgi:hypothetical protein
MKFTIKTLMVVSAAAVLLAGCEMDKKPANTPPTSAENPDNQNSSEDKSNPNA